MSAIRETWFENGIKETASISVVRLSRVQMLAWGGYDIDGTGKNWRSGVLGQDLCFRKVFLSEILMNNWRRMIRSREAPTLTPGGRHGES